MVYVSVLGRGSVIYVWDEIPIITNCWGDKTLLGFVTFILWIEINGIVWAKLFQILSRFLLLTYLYIFSTDLMTYVVRVDELQSSLICNVSFGLLELFIHHDKKFNIILISHSAEFVK